MDVTHEILFVINDILNIMVKCVALMAMHCYIVYGRGISHEKNESN